ncbi:RNA polymerase sigma factor [Virgisporangium aurantiacum]|uniref:RNA polymerase sigma factor 70 region 4 type 2 domain-containing protein n=1 Tax=Virgisporangium aurantiacum TaxID=175570 RepID=A0A8J4EAA1_9ACTN|nr:RNA polymerase sigma factor [Virgisporangium aurantiacum]GIJ64557.1 hypothetical protein Vau01_120730 [Virgisporangium aurantiacum]
MEIQITMASQLDSTDHRTAADDVDRHRTHRSRRPSTETAVVPADSFGAGIAAGVVAGVRAGDRDAFAALYHFTVDRITGYVTASVRQGDRHLIDDLVQDTYCLALAEPHHIDPDLIGSMYRLAARSMANHTRSQRHHLAAARTYTDRPTTAAPQAHPGDQPVSDRVIAVVAVISTVTRTATSTVDSAAAGVTAAGLRHLLTRLEPPQRRVIRLRYLEGCSRPQAAARMGCSVGSVRWLEQQGLRRLRELCTA